MTEDDIATTSGAAAQRKRGRFLRMSDVVAQLGISQATINRLHRSGDFPSKVRISANATGWWEGEIEAWKADRTRTERQC